MWRQADFALLWSGQTVSEVGSAVTTLALPTLAIFSFRAGPAAVGSSWPAAARRSHWWRFSPEGWSIACAGAR